MQRTHKEVGGREVGLPERCRSIICLQIRMVGIGTLYRRGRYGKESEQRGL